MPRMRSNRNKKRRSNFRTYSGKHRAGAIQLPQLRRKNWRGTLFPQFLPAGDRQKKRLPQKTSVSLPGFYVMLAGWLIGSIHPEYRLTDFFKSVASCFRQFLGFKGRASRKEFWYFTLAEFLILQPLSIILIFVITIFDESLGAIVGLAYAAAALIPWCAVAFRRFCDFRYKGSRLRANRPHHLSS